MVKLFLCEISSYGKVPWILFDIEFKKFLYEIKLKINGFHCSKFFGRVKFSAVQPLYNYYSVLYGINYSDIL